MDNILTVFFSTMYINTLLRFTFNVYIKHYVKQVEQISAEFKVRALKYHPDKNSGDKKAEETFQKLNVSNITGVRASFDTQVLNIITYYFYYYYRLRMIYSRALQEAKETLCDPEKRVTYDKWKNSGVAVSYKTWLSNKEHFQQVRTVNYIQYNMQ